MRYKYSKYNGEDLDGVDLDDLLSKLSDLLLSSGFNGQPMSAWSDPDNTMQALHDAIMEALLNGGAAATGDHRPAPERTANKDRIEQLIKQLIDRLEQEGYITSSPDLEAEQAQRQARGTGNGQGQQSPPVTFEVTDKGLDFLGLPGAARPARLARQEQLRPARHARPLDRRRRRPARPSRTRSATRSTSIRAARS